MTAVTWDHPDADPTRDIHAMVRAAHPQQPTSRRPAYVHLPVTLYDTLVAAGTIDVTAFAAAHIIICRGTGMAALTVERVAGATGMSHRSATEWVVLDVLREHRYETNNWGSKPDDPGWHVCSCRWEGYWSDWQPHVAERIVERLSA